MNSGYAAGPALPAPALTLELAAAVALRSGRVVSVHVPAAVLHAALAEPDYDIARCATNAEPLGALAGLAGLSIELSGDVKSNCSPKTEVAHYVPVNVAVLHSFITPMALPKLLVPYLDADAATDSALDASADRLSLWAQSRKLYAVAAFVHTLQSALALQRGSEARVPTAAEPQSSFAQVCCLKGHTELSLLICEAALGKVCSK